MNLDSLGVALTRLGRDLGALGVYLGVLGKLLDRLGVHPVRWNWILVLQE